MTKRKATTKLTIVSEPITVEAYCPYCGYHNCQDYIDFDGENLWHNAESMLCLKCGNRFDLIGVEYD